MTVPLFLGEGGKQVSGRVPLLAMVMVMVEGTGLGKDMGGVAGLDVGVGGRGPGNLGQGISFRGSELLRPGHGARHDNRIP